MEQMGLNLFSLNGLGEIPADIFKPEIEGPSPQFPVKSGSISGDYRRETEGKDDF
jgi:hypothetical protein